MPPSEQFQQDPEPSYPYGVYTGVQQPQPEGPSQNFGERAWRENSYSHNEGMPEMQYQQQIYHEQSQHSQPQPQYAQPLAPTYAALLPEGRFFAALSYALCWFSGLVMLFFCWQNRFVRFHALQSLAFFGLVNVFDIVMLRMAFFTAHHFFHFWIFPMFLLTLLVNAIAGIAWLVCMVQAGLGNYYKLPIIGDIIMRKYMSQGPVK